MSGSCPSIKFIMCYNVLYAEVMICKSEVTVKTVNIRKGSNYRLSFFLFFFEKRGETGMKLTEKQKRFADYYIETGNASESARRAGYKGKNLNNIASENLAKPYIKAYLDQQLREFESKRIASAKEVLEMLTTSMRGEIDEEVIVIEGDGDGVSSARVVKKQIGLKDRIKAAELLGKRYRLFTDKIEVEGAVPVVIVGEDNLED